jgi:hypothetical protein
MRRMTSPPNRHLRQVLLGLAMVMLTVAGVAPPALAQAGDGNGTVVPRGARVGNVVVGEGDAIVLGQAGTVVALNGNVLVSGTVTGSAVATNGQVRVLSGGRVAGGAYSSVAPAVDQGGTVQGRVATVDGGAALSRAGNLLQIVWWIAATLALLAFGAAITRMLPGAMDATVETGTRQIGPSAITGVVTAVVLAFLIILFIITVVGLPLAVALFLIAVPLYLLGMFAAAWIFGTLIIRRRERRMLAFVVGIIVLQVVAIIPILGILVPLATIYGMGALLITAWRNVRRPAPAPATGTPHLPG